MFVDLLKLVLGVVSYASQPNIGEIVLLSVSSITCRTPENLHGLMRTVVDAYNFSQQGTLLQEAKDLMNPELIQKTEELRKLVEKHFM